MKINYIGSVAAIIALISLVLPWWTMTISATIGHETATGDLLIYLYKVTISGTEVSMNLWFGTAALILLVIGGITGIVGSVIIVKKGKILLVVTGALALLSIIIFAIGLQNELSKAPPIPDFPLIGLFSSGTFTYVDETPMQYFTYLTLGFWLALVAAILAFVSMLKHSKLKLEEPP